MKRLGQGALKGLLVGVGIGVALAHGLGWATTAGLLGYLIAMGTGATVGLVVGKPPWKQAGWVEGLLKAIAGLLVGALLYWLGSRFGSFELPFALLEAPAESRWDELPLVFAPLIASIFGALIELDNTPSGGSGGKASAKEPGGTARKAGKATAAEPMDADFEPF